MQYRHLVFYDGRCGLCDRAVQLILSADKKAIFAFAPLEGETAKALLNNLPEDMKNEDSLVLIENFQSVDRKYYVLGKAALKIAWLLGGYLAIPGALSFLPGILYNWLYRLVASNRHRFFPTTSCRLPDPKHKNRFIP